MSEQKQSTVKLVLVAAAGEIFASCVVWALPCCLVEQSVWFGLTLSGCGVFLCFMLVWYGHFERIIEYESSAGLCDGTKIKIDTYSYVVCM